MSNYRPYWQRHPIQRRVASIVLLPIMPAAVLLHILPEVVAYYLKELRANYKDAWEAARDR